MIGIRERADVLAEVLRELTDGRCETCNLRCMCSGDGTRDRPPYGGCLILRARRALNEYEAAR